MVRSSILLIAGALAAGISLGLGSAAAAPQILGLVASNGAIPLTCGEEACSADLSTFCLQQPRANPEPGQRYELADGGAVTLVGTTAGGETLRLPAAPYMTFASTRGFTAVEIAVSSSVIARLGLTALAVEVARSASLVPVTAADDPDPQADDEMALALGAYRQQGGKYFDDSGEAADAIRLTNRMINELPKHQRRPTDTDGHLVEVALRSEMGERADPAGVALVRSHHDACVVKTDVTHHIGSMRACLQGTHDRLVTHANIDFWNSLGSY
jgi:hypothetical protein